MRPDEVTSEHGNPTEGQLELANDMVCRHWIPALPQESQADDILSTHGRLWPSLLKLGSLCRDDQGAHYRPNCHQDEMGSWATGARCDIRPRIVDIDKLLDECGS
jgi:hypothetical protein